MESNYFQINDINKIKEFYNQFIGICYKYDRGCYRKIFKIEYANQNNIRFHGVEIDEYNERIEMFFISLVTFEQILKSSTIINSNVYDEVLNKIKQGILKNIL